MPILAHMMAERAKEKVERAKEKVERAKEKVERAKVFADCWQMMTGKETQTSVVALLID